VGSSAISTMGSCRMLEPSTRAALTDQLRPPQGFQLVHAVGTTFTLNLETALTIPLSFAAHRVSESDGALGVLDAVRRAADNIDIFAQAGQLAMGTRSDLVAFLEPMVHPVIHRRGLFHPKVWFLEYRSENQLAYRFLCASRNLTTDRSWDVVVRLDGTVAYGATAKREASVRNAPIAGLLSALPRMAVQPLASGRMDRIHELAKRWRSVEWEAPADLRDIDFHVFGMKHSRSLDFSGKRALIISPFLSDSGLRELRSAIRTETHLISRAESIKRLVPSSLDPKLHTYVLDDSAAQSPATDQTDSSNEPGSSTNEVLVGLHAKVFVVDRADGAHIFAGSANATGAALLSNVEVMVELVGPLPRYGVQPTIDALGELIYEDIFQAGEQPNADEEALRSLESYLRAAAGTRLIARVEAGEPYSLAVWADEPLAAEADINLRWELLTRPDLGAPGVPPLADRPARLSYLELTDITPFVVMIASDTAGRERRTILLAELIDDVAERRDAIIARQLTDTASFIRLLTLLLELTGLGAGVGAAGGLGFFGTGTGEEETASGLFEALVRAVGTEASGLGEVRRLVDFLAANGEGTALFPDGFVELWEAVWAANVSLVTEESNG
jgi:hypothetical protein